MNNNKNIHVVETDYYSRLAFNKEEGKYIYKKDPFRYSNQEKIENIDIYITSDGFITENSWICHDSTLITTAKEVEDIDSEWKIVVLTTDVDLIKDGVQAIDDYFLEWFIKNQSCEEVELKQLFKDDLGFWVSYLDLLQNEPLREVESKYKIIIPKEEPKQETRVFGTKEDKRFWSDKPIQDKHPDKQETLEEFIEKTIDKSFEIQLASSKIEKYMKIAAKWQKEQMYSDEDMKKSFNGFKTGKSFEEWFEQFKNK